MLFSYCVGFVVHERKYEAGSDADIEYDKLEYIAYVGFRILRDKRA